MRFSTLLNRKRSMLFVLMCVALPVALQSQESSLKPTLGPDVATYWKIINAGLVVETQGTTGSLKIQNLSDAALDGVVFYAEYLDSKGRRCFSLVFSQSTNIGDEQTAIPAGGTRSLYSSAGGMSPASKPTEVRIHLLQQARIGESPVRIESVPEQSPVTMGESIAETRASIQLALPSGSKDLVLARVTVDRDGGVRETKILSALNPQTTEWFQSFVHGLNFYPATTDGRPENAETLVGVQVNLSSDANPYILPTSYTDDFKDQVPPVNRILLGSTSRSDTLKVVRIGSQWSDTAYKWVRDDNMPHHVSRQLASNSSLK